MQRIYNLGARSFWTHSTGPIGCLGYILVGFPTAGKDDAGCAKPYSEGDGISAQERFSSICIHVCRCLFSEVFFVQRT
jgi:hypothetical protein